MDRNQVNSFLKFLETATEKEIEVKQQKSREILSRLDQKGDVAADIRFCLRLIDQELVTRSDLFRVRQQRKA